MPLWNKRAVSSGQTEESYKEQLQSLKQTVNFGIKKPSKKEGLSSRNPNFDLIISGLLSEPLQSL